jgi:hypothetical protein
MTNGAEDFDDTRPAGLSTISRPQAPSLISRLQRRAVEEYDGILIVIGGIGTGVATTVPDAHSLTIPGVASLIVGGVLRIFRLRYELGDVQKSVVDRVELMESTIATRVTAVALQVSALRETRLLASLHEAERCDRRRFYTHMLSALHAAQKTVDVTQLDSHGPPQYATPEMQEYYKRHPETVKDRPHVQFRRIIAVPTLNKLDWLVDVLERTVGTVNFQIRLIDMTRAGDLPAPLSLQIFDRRELCLIDPVIGYILPEEQQNMLWIKGEAVANVFSSYYDTLWDLATRVREGALLYTRVLDDLLTVLAERQPEEAELADSLRKRIDSLAGRTSQSA